MYYIKHLRSIPNSTCPTPIIFLSPTCQTLNSQFTISAVQLFRTTQNYSFTILAQFVRSTAAVYHYGC